MHKQMGKLHNTLDPWEHAKLENIHQASLDILECVGVWVDSDDVLDITIKERGIGAHFLDCETTLFYLREAYYAPTLFYRKRKSEWLREGAKDLLVRAHGRDYGRRQYCAAR